MGGGKFEGNMKGMRLTIRIMSDKNNGHNFGKSNNILYFFTFILQK